MAEMHGQQSIIIRDTIETVGGKTFKGEITPGGLELWSVVIPEGDATISVSIEILVGPAQE